MKKLFAFLFIFCATLIPLRAEEGGYFDPEYPYENLQRILVVTSAAEGDERAELFRTLMISFPEQVRHKLARKDFAPMLYEDFVNEYTAIYGEEPEDIRPALPSADENPEFYLAERAEDYRNSKAYTYISESFDAILLAHIAGADTGVYRTPGYTDWRPRYHRYAVYNKDGEIVGYDTYVSYDTYYVPPRQYAYRRVAIIYTLVDATDAHIIGRYAYIRDGNMKLSTLARKTAGAYASRLKKLQK